MLRVERRARFQPAAKLAANTTATPAKSMRAFMCQHTLLAPLRKDQHVLSRHSQGRTMTASDCIFLMASIAAMQACLSLPKP
jgi:hypothetical protein